MPPAQLSRPRGLVWSGYAVFIWSIGYMLPHLYWALGGTLGMSLLKPSVLELPQWQMINWVASVFLTAAGILGLAFIYFRKRVFLSWLLLVIALVGCSVATSHGIYGIVNRILQIAGMGHGLAADFGNLAAEDFILDQDESPGLGVKVAGRPAGRFQQQALVFNFDRVRAEGAVAGPPAPDSLKKFHIISSLA